MVVALQKQHYALINSAQHTSAQVRLEQDIQIANQEYAIRLTALSQELAALDKSGREYTNKLKQLQDMQLQLVKQHEAEVAEIKQKSQIQQNQSSMASITQMQSMFATGFSQVIMGHKSFASMMNGIGNEVVSGMLKNTIMSMMTLDMDKEKQAASAARMAFIAGMHFPFPANIVMAPALGAAAFASVMAFQVGTDRVPGVGTGDIVPAKLEPGEGVVPGGVMDGLRKMAASGTLGGGGNQPTVHIHHRPTYHINTIDGDGISDVLEKHSEQFVQHTQSVLRRLNR